MAWSRSTWSLKAWSRLALPAAGGGGTTNHITSGPTLTILTVTSTFKAVDSIKQGPSLGILSVTSTFKAIDKVISPGISLAILTVSPTAFKMTDKVVQGPTLGVLSINSQFSSGSTSTATDDYVTRVRRRQ